MTPSSPARRSPLSRSTGTPIPISPGRLPAPPGYTRPHPPLTTPARFFRRYEGQLAAEPFSKTPKPGTSPDVPGAFLPAPGEIAAPRRETTVGCMGYYACVDYLDDCLGDLLRELSTGPAPSTTRW